MLNPSIASRNNYNNPHLTPRENQENYAKNQEIACAKSCYTYCLAQICHLISAQLIGFTFSIATDISRSLNVSPPCDPASITSNYTNEQPCCNHAQNTIGMCAITLPGTIENEVINASTTQRQHNYYECSPSISYCVGGIILHHTAPICCPGAFITPTLTNTLGTSICQFLFGRVLNEINSIQN